VKTPISLPLASLKAKFLASFSAIMFPPNSKMCLPVLTFGIYSY
jgi:hypothetical protein